MSTTIGFLAVRYHAEHGFFGGYLIVNHLARPLEFHCTMPVKPNRTQSLLYGSTLSGFVCGEQIGKALYTKAKLKPNLLLADSSAALAITNVCTVPAAQLVGEPHAAATVDQSFTVPDAPELETRDFVHGDVQLSIPISSRVGDEVFSDHLAKLSDNFELSEPFQRVVEALLEAHPIARAA